MTTYIQTQKATQQLNMNEPSSHSAVSGGKERKHVMTNKQHTKFHISYIKDQTCRHKSMAASCQTFTCQVISTMLYSMVFPLMCKILSKTFKHKRATYRLSMSEPSSHSAGSEKRRKHVMTNKQHTKFHISYIKDQTCRHKSMAASCQTFTCQAISTMLYSRALELRR